MLGSLGLPEIFIIGLVAILLFGGKKIGDIGKGVGDGLREWKKASREMADAEREVKK